VRQFDRQLIPFKVFNRDEDDPDFRLRRKIGMFFEGRWRRRLPRGMMMFNSIVSYRPGTHHLEMPSDGLIVEFDDRTAPKDPMRNPG
jgi:hypothetical protein